MNRGLLRGFYPGDLRLYDLSAEMTAAGGETYLKIRAPIYPGSLRVYKNGDRQTIAQATLDRFNKINFAVPAVALDVYIVEYMSTVQVRFPAALESVDADPHFANVVFLSHLEGANHSTTIVDVTGKHTWSCTGDAEITTANFAFGASSLDLGSSGGGNINVASAHADFGFATGDWTVEYQAYVHGISGAGYNCAFDCRDGTNGFAIYCGTSSDGPGLRVYNNTTLLLQAGVSLINYDVWFYSAVKMESGTLSANVGGYTASTSYSTTFGTSCRPYIGTTYGNTQPQVGQFDEIRITKGIGRDISVIPTRPFPNH